MIDGKRDEKLLLENGKMLSAGFEASVQHPEVLTRRLGVPELLDAYRMYKLH